ncbi:THAP domain containing 12b isoform X1 [Alosa sapidissima]|uniref:THAP domain containing 12b isoform X1 n=2 Tax=Alosa sapidissima TaxID=34773 RepID=UPI001C09C4CB|nr:THAP domain containing 12b isoform X1 [Alosa sapidissima]
MPNFCAAPNCTRKSTQSNLAFFRFPRDPERCRLWVENCRRADLETKTSDQLNKHYRLCAKHFEPAMICKTSPYRTVLRETAIPTIFDLTSHLNNPHSRHRKRIKELTEEDIRKIKERRLESSIEQLHSKKDKGGVVEEVEAGVEAPQLTPEQREQQEYIKSLLETVLLMGRQNIPLRTSIRRQEEEGEEERKEEEGEEEDAAFVPSNFQALLEARLSAGDEVLRGRFEGAAVNVDYCSTEEQQRLLEFCARSVQQNLLQEVRDASFFSLVTDDLVEFPGGARLPVFLRFVDQASALREELVELVLLEADAEPTGLAERLEALVTEHWGLSMEHCRGQAHASSGTFAGHIKTVASRLSDKYPMAVHTPQSSCALNVHLANCVPLAAVQTVMATLGKVHAFLRSTPTLQDEMDRVIGILFQGSPEKAESLRQACRCCWSDMHNLFEVAVELMEPLMLCMDSLYENEERMCSDRVTSSAFFISEVLSDFEFVVTLVILKNTLSFTRAFGKNLQGETLDVFFAANSLTAVLHSLNEVMDNIEVYHEFWFEEAVNLAATMGITVCVPRVVLLRKPSADVGEMQPEAYFKEYLTLPIMQFITQEVKDIFSENHLKALKCLSLVPAVMGQMKFNTSEESHAHGYRGDLPNPDTLPAELHCWRIKWKHRGKEVRLPATIHETLQLSDVKFFPNVNAFLKVLSTLPVLRLEHGSRQTAQQRLQAHLEHTPVDCRCPSMALLHINYHLVTDLDQMVEQYTKQLSEDDHSESDTLAE